MTLLSILLKKLYFLVISLEYWAMEKLKITAAIIIKIESKIQLHFT